MKASRLVGVISILVCLAVYTMCFGESDKPVPDQKQQITNLYGKLPLTFVENKGQFNEKVRFCARSPKATVYFCQNEVVFHFVQSGDTMHQYGRYQRYSNDANADSTRTDDLMIDCVPGQANTVSASVPSANSVANPLLREPSRSSLRLVNPCPPSADSWLDLFSSLNPQSEIRNPQSREASSHKELVLRVSFPDSNSNVVIEGLDKLSGKVNVFRGSDQSRWLTDISTYKKVIYHNLWEGIDLVYYGMPEYGMKYDFVVHPNADPSKAKFKYAGHDKLSVNSDGELIIDTAFGEIAEKKPYIYQEIKGDKKEIKGTFSLRKDIVSLNIGNYDKNYQLVIDPGLVYSTFLGGTHSEWGYGISVDSSGCAYIAGGTYSADFPITTGAFDASLNGWIDAFVTKFNASGTGLIYSTFLGGTNDESCYSVDIDSSGCAYMTGYTNSGDFPVTDKAFDRSFSSTTDVFVTKLNESGTGLIFSTFLGGANIDYGYGIAVDSSNRAYVTGNTHSTDFPITANPFDSSYNGSYDAFVTKLNVSGSALVYSTFLGGIDTDSCYGIAIDSSGCAYVTGCTYSADFPITISAYDALHNGNYDAFVTKLNASGSALLYSTFLGSTSLDWAESICVDSSGCAYVAGYTDSANFPVTASAFDISYNGGDDVFVTKLNAFGSGLGYSTFVGGAQMDWATDIVVDSSSCAYLTGYTASTDFPTTATAYDISFDGWVDVFVTKLNASGTGLAYSTFLGESDEDRGYAVAVDSSGCAYATGHTGSADFPTTIGAFSTLYNGGLIDAFVTKILTALRIYSIVYGSDGATIYWNGVSGVSYIVEWSTDLLSWNPVSVGQVSEWMDTNAVSYSKKFYRAREE